MKHDLEISSINANLFIKSITFLSLSSEQQGILFFLTKKETGYEVVYINLFYHNI